METIVKSKIVRVFYIIVGSISLFLGVLGLFLPILPTTPFLLLTAYLYAKSSKRLYLWILNNKIFGKYIDNYRTGRGIALQTKIMAVSLLWITILYSAIFIIPFTYVKILIILIAISVTIHILGNTTYRKHKN